MEIDGDLFGLGFVFVEKMLKTAGMTVVFSSLLSCCSNQRTPSVANGRVPVQEVFFSPVGLGPFLS